MSIERKLVTGEFKADGSGEVVATFSRFGVLDHDADITLPSAIKDGAPVLVGSWNHSSVTGTALPIGKGVIRNDGTRAYLEAQLFDTPNAQAHHEVLKGLGGLGQWSYAYQVIEASTDYAELRGYPQGTRRILKAVDVFEVSPVVRAAGIGTETDSIKGDLLRLDPELAEFVRQNELVVMRDSAIALRKSALVQRALRGQVTDAEFDEVLSWR